jgi:hypothetical protein
VALVVLAGGLVYGVSPPVRERVDTKVSDLRERFLEVFRPSYVPANPVEVTTNSASEEHPALAAADGFNNTYWSSLPDADRPFLKFRFDSAVDLEKAIIQNGNSDDFKQQARPRLLHFVYSDNSSQDVTLEDKPGEQQVDLDAGPAVDAVEIYVLDSYPATTGRTDVAITEIELFAKKKKG